MAWAEDQIDTGAVADWELELLQMRYTEGHQPRPSSHQPPPVSEPMELSPDPFFLSNMHPPANQATTSTTSAVHNQTLLSTQPTLTSSASCPSFTSFYDIDSDDLLRDIPDGEPLGEPLMGGGGAFGSGPMGVGMGMGPSMDMPGGYDYVLQFQQQHQNGAMRQFPHQSSVGTSDHMAVLQQSRRPIHMSASFTSLSSMETEYRRRLVTKRKKAVAERWNKAQRHKSFDSTNSSVATAPSPTTSMEFSAYNNAGTFESTPETHFLENVPLPRRPTESDMVGFSIDDFPTTFTSDASWPMPPPLSLANGGVPFEGYSDAQPQLPASSDMDQLLLSDQEKANVSSLLDAIRDFDSPLPTHQEGKATVPQPKRSSPTMTGRPRGGSGHHQHRTGRSPHLRGIARTDGFKRKEVASAPSIEDTAQPSIRERLQLVLEKSPIPLVLCEDEKAYLALAPQFSPDKVNETAGSLWLLLHAARCFEPTCAIGGCDVMRRVIRHCRGCDSPLGKCRDPCNDAKAMLFHHATCKQANKPAENDGAGPTCLICAKMQEIEKNHNALNARPPLSPQLKPNSSPPLMPMPPLGMSTLSSHGGPVLIAPQPVFSSPLLKPAPSGPSASKHVPIQPNPLPTASNPMGMIGTFPHFGVSLTLYLEQTSPPFRAELKNRVEKRVTNAAGLDLIQHMQKKTRLRSLEDLRSEARSVVLGEMERELHLHMQAVNWANVATSTTADASGSNANQPAASTATRNEAGLPLYLLNIAAAGFAAFYAQQASLQAAMVSMGPYGMTPPSRQSLSRQSSTGSMATSASSSSLSSIPLAPKRSASALSLSHPSPKETTSGTEKSKETPLTV